MRTSSSPTALAARRFAAGEASRPPVQSSWEGFYTPTEKAASIPSGYKTPPAKHPFPPETPAVPKDAACELWCEWPRRVQSLPPFRGIRQALQQIQAIQTRHA